MSGCDLDSGFENIGRGGPEGLSFNCMWNRLFKQEIIQMVELKGN